MMNSNNWIRKALSLCLVAAITATYSMSVLASPEKIAGELLVNGKTLDGQPASVQVNGEAAQSGRALFTGSTITTPGDTSAIISLGKAGKIELAPNTTASLSFNEKAISGNLTAGRITVLNASEGVSITTAEGKTVNLNAGDSADAAAQTQTKDNNGDNGHGLLLYAIILGGATAGIIFAVTTNNNRVALGGTSTVVSVTR